MTLGEVLNLISDRAATVAALNNLPIEQVVGDSDSDSDPQRDIARLLAVAQAASEALTQPPLNASKQTALWAIISKCVARAHWLSDFDPTSNSWLT